MPDTPAKLEATDPSAIEIPTVPSALQEWSTRLEGLFNKLAALPLDEMITSATGAMGGIKDLAASPELHQAIRRADGLLLTSRGSRGRPPMVAHHATPSPGRDGCGREAAP